MDYEKEIHAFYDWLETNSIPPSAIVLWHALMHISNKAAWATEFAVAKSLLEAKTGLKKDAIYSARNILKQKGRIDFKERGTRATVYRIIPFHESSLSENLSEKPTSEYHSSEKPTSNPTSDCNLSEKPTSEATITRQIDRQAIRQVDRTYIHNNRQIDRQTDRQTRASWSDIECAWQEVFGMVMKPNHIEMINAFMDQDGMDESLILEGIERVRQADKPVLNYLWRTLANWAKQGIQNIRDLLEYEKNRVDAPTGNVTPFPKKSRLEANYDALKAYAKEHGIDWG
ncbi:DnaD domain-containing protein [Parageobacillus thermoglucosidasius]|uniref:DnaD domain-containing protein n=1 Tax=Parageobacillus thermoglucosidasius TaxID=1426 RepID=UPI0016285C4C|nr:DnaD domain protein [Parageobacillus thermoglucosidasius]MED4904096.1 DnaD domain protein [Parageobacillus thermoglucosidasius]MED4915646.1 DnaD domain protein [Parageobacillus thermoglucosidasius]MED4945089.1 DnaD domain protein [Parageobacillus thermoglucosidasius]MED4983714.1 DnaD domain protein [Parageobacillus thermoglucosidasius]